MGRRTDTLDWTILISVLVLLCFGLATLLSLQPLAFVQQLLFSLLGLVLFYFFYKSEFFLWCQLDRWIYIASLLFLGMTVLVSPIRGSSRWIQIAGFQIQPAELIKPFFILSIASLLNRYPPNRLKNLVGHLLLFLIPLVILINQPDIGNTIVFGFIWLGMILVSDLPLYYLVFGTAGFVLGLPLIFNLLRGYQKLRILTFLNPVLDPQGAGYHAIQSQIAVGSGKLWGRGFGRGTQTILQFLPEKHTDFIFASFVEELGFIGGMLMLAVFFVLLWQLVKKSQSQVLNHAVFLYIIGFFCMIFIQTVVNIGMNMGILPITGITLPFVSYGGSSLVSLMIGLGLYMAALNQSRSQQW